MIFLKCLIDHFLYRADPLKWKTHLAKNILLIVGGTLCAAYLGPFASGIVCEFVANLISKCAELGEKTGQGFLSVMGETLLEFPRVLLSWFFPVHSPQEETKSWSIPLDMQLPADLTCFICRGLYYKPTRCQGKFYCRSCIKKWVNNHNTDPYYQFTQENDLVFSETMAALVDSFVALHNIQVLYALNVVHVD